MVKKFGWAVAATVYAFLVSAVFNHFSPWVAVLMILAAAALALHVIEKIIYKERFNEK